MPSNKEEWWELVENNWDDLKSLIETFHPTKKPPKLKITARTAEGFRKLIASEITSLCDYETLKNNRNPELVKVLDQAYWGIPESTDCWRYKGFGLLCDLCSESYVLFEENCEN